MVQVVLNKVLDPSIRAPLSEENINNIVVYKDDTVKCAEELDPKIQLLIDQIVPKGSGSLIMVPILATERRGKEI